MTATRRATSEGEGELTPSASSSSRPPCASLRCAPRPSRCVPPLSIELLLVPARDVANSRPRILRAQSDRLDLLAFSTYGALHFASPIVAGWWIWGFGSQGAASTFGWTLGAQNLAGLATHLVFPNAAPWLCVPLSLLLSLASSLERLLIYRGRRARSYDVYGIDAAQPDYTYPGNPAGLVRVDTILGSASSSLSRSPLNLSTSVSDSPLVWLAAHIYAKAFGKGPVVFGAIPSLHAATAICCCLFVCRYSKGYRGLTFMWIYCGVMFWSTQYFHHHVRRPALPLSLDPPRLWLSRSSPVSLPHACMR